METLMPVIRFLGRMLWHSVKLVWALLLCMTAVLMFAMSVLVTVCVVVGDR
jgi:hypothetical protein